MSLQLPFGVRVLNPFPVEDKYLNNGIPYTGTSQVNSLLAAGVRHTGLTVNISGVEYWYATGVTNSSLVVKSPSVVSGGGITGATNGLTKTGSKIKLGGTLTGNTTIEGGGKNFNLGSSTTLKKFNIVASGSSDWQVGDVFFHTVSFAENFFMSDSTGFEMHSGNNKGNFYLNQNGSQGPFLSSSTGFPVTLQGGSSNVVSIKLQNAAHQFTISDNRGGTGQTGIEYAANYSTNFSPRSLVDKGYVTGITSTISVPVTGATNGLSVQSGKVILGGSLNQGTSIFGDETTPLLINIAQSSSPFGGSALAMSNNSGLLKWEGTGNVGTSRFESGNGYFQVLAAEAANLPTPRSFSFFWLPNNGVTLGVASGATGTQVRMYQTGLTFYSTYSGFKGVQYAVDYSANFSPRSLVDKGYVTGLTSSSGVQTANNGLTKSGTNVHLGGSLTGNTTIRLASSNLSITGGTNNKITLSTKNGANVNGQILIGNGNGVTISESDSDGIFLNATGGLFAQGNSSGFNGLVLQNNLSQFYGKQGVFQINGGTTTILSKDLSNNPLIQIDLSQSTGTYTDSRTGTTAAGLQYGADYSANYTSRSLVDKGYTDSIAAGLDPKEAVFVATTAPLAGVTYFPTGGTSLTGAFTGASTVIDGITLSNGNRILVKNQVDPKQNGIYTVISSGTWYRSSDLDGTPAAEVAGGDFLFVQTGATLAATGWVLTGNGVLTINTDPLNFVQFSAANSYVAGSGISIVGNTISNLHTYSNGLTKTSNNVKLGGTLTSDVDIEGNSGNTAGFYVGTNNFPVNFYQLIAGDASYTNFSSQKLLLNRSEYSFIGSGQQKAMMKFDSTGIDLRGGFNSGNGDTVIHLGGNSIHSTYFQDSRTGTGQTGLEYFANYSANFTPRSLVDKAYVTGLTTTSGIQTANNGLTKAGTNVHLGGTLTGNTRVLSTNSGLIFDVTGQILGAQSIVLGSGDIVNFINQRNYLGSTIATVGLYTGGATFNNYFETSSGGTDMYSDNFTQSTKFKLTPTTAIFTDGRTVKKGIEYAANYSAGFTPRSLVDKAYVTGLTTTSGIQTASNGLTKTGTNVTLGGNLSSDADIEGNSGNTAGFYIGQNLYPVNLFEVIAGSADYSNTARIDMRSTRGRLSYYGGGTLKSRVETTTTGVHLYGGNPDGAATKTQIDLGSASTGHSFLITDSRTTQYGIEYNADYSSNFTARSLVDKGFVTGQTSGSKLKTIVIVMSSTTLTTTTDLALVATSGGTYTVTLPASPSNGYHVAIKDDSGNAFNNNITVNGNGHNIDGASTFVINTDFGSAEMTYSSVRSKWYVTAFVS